METFSAIGQLGGGDMDVGLAHSTVLRRLWGGGEQHETTLAAPNFVADIAQKTFLVLVLFIGVWRERSGDRFFSDTNS